MTGLDLQALEEQSKRLLEEARKADQDPNRLPPPAPTTHGLIAGYAPDELERATQEALDQRQKQEDQQFALSLAQGFRADPNLAAEAQRLAGVTGGDALTIEKNIDRFRAAAADIAAKRMRLANGDTALGRMMMDPRFMRVASDDLDNLSGLQRAALELTRGLMETRLMDERGQLATRLRDRGLTTPELRRLDSVNRQLGAIGQVLPGGFISTGTQFASTSLTIGARAIQAGLAAGLAAGGTALAAGQLGPQAATPEEVVTVPAAAIGAFSVVALSEAFRQTTILEGGNLYQDLLDYRGELGQRIDPETAATVSRVAGPVSGALELVGAGLVGRGANVITAPVRRRFFQSLAQETAQALTRPGANRAAADFAKGYLTGFGGEITTEFLQEVNNIAAEEIAKGADGLPLDITTPAGRDRIASRLGEVIAKTAQGMVFLAGVGPAAGFVSRSNRLAQSKVDVQLRDQAFAMTGKAQLPKRSPEWTEQLLAQTYEGTRAENMYVPAERFVEAVADTNISDEQLARDLPEVVQQLPAALESGGDVLIPTATYQARILDTELDGTLRQHVRMGTNGFSETEIAQVEAAQEELAEAAAQAVEERAVTFAESGRAVEQEFQRQVEQTRRVSPAAARETAATFRAFVETLAAERNLTPAELSARFGLQVERGEAATDLENILAQPVSDRAREMFDEARRRLDERKALAGELAEPGQAIPMGKEGGREALASADPRRPGAYRLTFVEDGTPTGHAEHDTLADAVEAGLREGYEPVNRDQFLAQRQLEARQEGELRAAFDPDRGVIRLFERADVTSVLHEMGHAFLHWYGRLAESEVGPTRVRADLEAFLDWRGIEGGVDAWNAMSLDEQRPHHEAFAESFETYAFEGKAPSKGLERAFQRFQRWITRLWRNIRGEVQELDPVLRGVFDRMLAAEDAIAQVRAERELEPLFAEQPEGMSDAEWATYQRAFDDQLGDAVNEVTRRSLRDLQWLRNASGKELRRLQRKHDQTRKDMAEEVREELEAEPVYRALEFLRRGRFVNEEGLVTEVEGPHKLRTSAVEDILRPRAGQPTLIGDMELLDAIVALGGLSREQALAEGIDTGDITRRRGIRPVFPKAGRQLDAMRELLEEQGFPFEDPGQLLEALDASLRGGGVFGRRAVVAGAEVQAMAEEEAARQGEEAPRVDLRKLRITTPEGLAPDQVADMFGYPSGEALVGDVAAARPLQEVVDERVDARMMAENAELVDAAAIQRAVDQAMGTPARARFIATGLKALTRGRQPVRLMVNAARRIAERNLSTMPVSQIKPWRFERAETQANKAALEAVARGDTQAAINAVRQELVQHEMARLARQVEVEVARTEKNWRKFFWNDARLGKTRDITLVWPGRALLRGVKFAPDVDGQQARQEAESLDKLREDFVAVSENLDSVADQVADRAYRSLALAEFRDVADVADQLWNLSRSENIVRIEGQRAQVEDWVAGGVETIGKLPGRLAPGAQAVEGRTPNIGERAVGHFWHSLASAKRFQLWSQFMDQKDPNGWFQTVMLKPMLRALNRYRERRDAIFARLGEQVRKLETLYGSQWDDRIAAPELNYVSRVTGELVEVSFRGVRELVDVLYDIGNTSNLEKRLVGEGWAPRPAETGGVLLTEKWDRFFERVTQPGGLVRPELMEHVSSVWAEFDALKAEAQAVHLETLGYEFNELELTDVALPWGTITGGYAPLRTDIARQRQPRRNVDIVESVQGFEQDYQYSRHAIGPQRGFTMDRNPNYYGQLTMDIGRRFQAFDEELRFIHLQSHVKNVARILRHPEFEAAMNAYDREAITKIIEPWLDTSARQIVSRPSQTPWVDAAARWIRASTGMAYLAWRATVTLVQFTGFYLAKQQVSTGFLMKGFQSVFRGQGWSQAIAKSKRMRDRLTTDADKVWDHIRSQSAQGPRRRTFRQFRDNAQRFAWLPMRYAQGFVDVVTWNGAYQQALAQTPAGMDMEAAEARAVEEADLAVERSQGGGLPENLARFQTDIPAMRLLYQFMDFGNVFYNQVLVRAGVQPTTARKIAAFMWMPMMLSFWETLVRIPLEGPPEEDDDEWFLAPIAERYGENLTRNFAGMFPLVGPAAIAAMGGETDRMGTAPGIEALRQSIRGVSRLLETGEFDARAFGTFLTQVSGIPFSIPAAPADYLLDVEAGRVEPTGDLDFLRGLLTGRASEASRQ